MSRGIPSSVRRCLTRLDSKTDTAPIRRELAAIAARANRIGEFRLAAELRAVSDRPSREAMTAELAALHERRWGSPSTHNQGAPS